tara:strand:- start:3944 stop:5242 length:1299 start_codon:yes stop_codon:yes gene_type:complete
MNEALIIVIGLVVALNLVLSLSRPQNAIKNLIALIAYMQLCLGPYLYYTFYQGTEISQLWMLEMAVDSDLYFSYLLPGLIAFLIGLHFSGKRFQKEFDFDLTGGEAIKPLIFGGLICSLILYYPVPQSLKFLLTLGASLAKCGLLLFHIQRIRKATKIRGLITLPALLMISLLIYESSKSGMFEALVFWGFILLVSSLAVLPRSIGRNFTVVISGLILLVSLQTAKDIYRTLVWEKGQESSVIQIGSSLIEGYEISKENFNNPNFWFPIVERLNQGRIVSHVIRKIERQETKQDFKRIPMAFGSAFVPRLFWPDKPKAGGRENISVFTDINLIGSTSMNISYFSDFFISFGQYGGVISLFFWGFFLSSFIHKISTFTHKKYVVWLSPIVLIGLIPVETDLNMVINHIVKSTLFIILVSSVLAHIQRGNARNH